SDRVSLSRSSCAACLEYSVNVRSVVMNVSKQYWYYGRMGIILLASGGFLLLSLYARAWTEHNIFPILFPAVALSAWIGGRLGGLISTLALALGTAYFHLPPTGFAVDDTADIVRLGTFTF